MQLSCVAHSVGEIIITETCTSSFSDGHFVVLISTTYNEEKAVLNKWVTQNSKLNAFFPLFSCSVLFKYDCGLKQGDNFVALDISMCLWRILCWSCSCCEYVTDVTAILMAVLLANTTHTRAFPNYFSPLYTAHIT